MMKKPFANRWWYARPCLYTMKRLPVVRVYRCGDEYCNDILYLSVPLFGELTVRIGKNIRLNGRCDECVKEFGPWCPGCEDCHRGPRCHNWMKCINEDLGHDEKLQRCPICGGNYCPRCEQHPEENCPEGPDVGFYWDNTSQDPGVCQ